MKKILFVLTSHSKKGNTGQVTGFYLPEAAHPWDVLVKAGFDIDFVSPKGGIAPIDGVENPDEICRHFLASPSVQQKITHTLMPNQINATDYVGIYFVGGHGTMWDFPNDESLAQLTAQIYESGGVVAAVCHGPAGLVNVKLSDGSYLVKDKNISAFTDDEERAVGLENVVPFLLATTLVQRGAKHLAAPNWQKQVVVDGRLVTGQNPASAQGVGEAMLSSLT